MQFGEGKHAYTTSDVDIDIGDLPVLSSPVASGGISAIIGTDSILQAGGLFLDFRANRLVFSHL